MKVAEEGTFVANRVTYSIEDGWTALDATNHPGVYYREVNAVTADTDFYVLKDNKVYVSENLTKEDIKGLNGNKPTLTFTAYAVQKEGSNNAAEAWAKVNP